MNASTVRRSVGKFIDPDLAEQAIAGHGVPSQDPDPAAQFALSPEEEGREPHSVFMGGGLVIGAAVGAAIGVALAGPAGVFVGGTVGSIAGALGAAAAGAAMHLENSHICDPSHVRKHG